MTGQLTPATPSTVATGVDPAGIAFSPDGLYAYVCNATDGTISQYSVLGTVLTPLSPATVSAGSSPAAIVVSSDGLYAYVVNTSGSAGTISQYSISAGKLTARSPAAVACGLGALNIAITPNGQNVYVTNRTSGTISQYSATNGLLAPLSPATITLGAIQPAGLAVHPNGNYAYVTTQGNGKIYQYAITNGLLSPLSPATVSVSTNLLSISLSPDGHYAYASDFSNNKLYQFSITNGVLSALSPAFLSLTDPVLTVVDPLSLNAYVLTTAANPSPVAQYSMSSGALTALSPATVDAGGGYGAGGYGLAMSPLGNLVLVSNGGDNTLSAFTKPTRPVASFVYTPQNEGTPLTVNFVDTSTNIPTSWAWDFGDSNTSTLRNPTHIFSTIGTFTVSLVATNAIGSSPAYTQTVVAGPNFNCDCDDVNDNETLSQLRRRMLVRLGYSAQADNPPPGMADLLDDFLVQSQRYLYRRYQAIRTIRFFTWTMTAGVRFYDIPDTDGTCTRKLDPLKVQWVGLQDLNNTWYQMYQGIPPEFYTSVNFLGYPSRYEIRQCIEVFPAPAAAYKLRIKGEFGLDPLVADDDKTTLDSELVFMWALANAKAHYGQTDAQVVASQAETYLKELVAGAHMTARYVPGTSPAMPYSKPVFLPLQNP